MPSLISRRRPPRPGSSLGSSLAPGLAPRPAPRPALPPTLQTLELVSDGRPLTLLRSATPSDYERGLMHGQDWGTADVVWLLRRLLHRPGLGRRGTLIDVGANIGLVCLPLAQDGTRVIACEMLPANCLKLQLACLLNGLTRVQVIQAAISSADGLLAYGGADGWGKVGAGAQQALALRLDTVMRLPGVTAARRLLPGVTAARRLLPGVTAARRLVIKIDVEGHELEVLRGAAELIASHRPAILFESIEFADRAEDVMSLQCKRLLEALGYKLLLQRGRRLLPRAASELQEGVVADYLALPREAPDWLRGLPTGRLTPQERVDWVAEMAAQQDASHRRHAVAAVVRLREEDASCIGRTEAIAAMLRADPDDDVRACAETAFT